MFKSLFAGQGAHHGEGKLLFEQGMAAASQYKCREALEFYTRSIEASPNPAPYINRAAILTWQQRFHEALLDLQEAARLDRLQGNEFVDAINSQIEMVEPICQHWYGGHKDEIVDTILSSEDDYNGPAEFISDVWDTRNRALRKSAVFSRLQRFHFFNEIDSIRKFNGFDHYPTTHQWCDDYPEQFIKQELTCCPDQGAYVDISAHVSSYLCLLDEQKMARFRESFLWRIHSRMIIEDYGLEDDPGVIRDATQFMGNR